MVINFANENTKVKLAWSTGNHEVTSQWDKFIHMLVVISQNTDFDLKYVCSFLITDVPLFISYPDGSQQGTNKDLLFRKLEASKMG